MGAPFPAGPRWESSGPSLQGRVLAAGLCGCPWPVRASSPSLVCWRVGHKQLLGLSDAFFVPVGRSA